MIYSENILICIAVPLFVMMLFVPRKSRRLFMGLIIGMVGSLLGAYLNGFFGNVYHMDAMRTARYIAPIVEESMKLVPILLYMLLLNPKEQEMIGFSVAVGAGFATFENCCYITQNGYELISFILIRGLAVGIMHVVCGLVIGISMILVKQYRSVMIPGTIGSFTFAMTIHALYNLLVSVEGVSSVIGFYIPIIILIIIYFVWVYQREEIE